MRSIVIGLGETGAPLRRILDCDGLDPFKGVLNSKGNYEFLHICIPYADKFVEMVSGYQKQFRPRVTVIHSTVPIGTTSKIKNAVHSPILGRHNNMEESIRKFAKWVGGKHAEEVAEYFSGFGLDVRVCKTSEETEALKLMCLMKYGVYIAVAQYQKDICDKLGFEFNDVFEWDKNYNNHVAEHLERPFIHPPGDKIGGHCVLQNMPHLYKFAPSRLIEEVLKFKPVERSYDKDLATQ